VNLYGAWTREKRNYYYFGDLRGDEMDEEIENLSIKKELAFTTGEQV